MSKFSADPSRIALSVTSRSADRRVAGSSPGRNASLKMHAISNPLSLGNGDLRVVVSGHFCASLQVGHARSNRPVFDYRITGVEAQIKTKQNKQIWKIMDM